MSRDFRSAVCEFGEKTCHVLLGLYDQKDTCSPILEFLRFQVAIHHPGGARTTDQGAVVVDPELWATQLNRVYANLVETAVQNVNRRNSKKAPTGQALFLDPLLAAECRSNTTLTLSRGIFYT